MPLFEANPVNLQAVSGWRERPNWVDTISARFGINAIDRAAAEALARSAVEHAYDRNGEYCGGPIIDVPVDERDDSWEIFSWREYHLQSPGVPGIFYVGGITSRSISLEDTAEWLPELARWRQMIRERGQPEPSFRHPPLRLPPPRRVRYLCVSCGAWRESPDASLLVQSMVTGYSPGSAEHRKVQAAKRSEAPFFARHLEECAISGQEVIIGVYEGDPTWDALDPAKCEA